MWGTYEEFVENLMKKFEPWLERFNFDLNFGRETFELLLMRGDV
jgi:hypothetical protein